MFFLSQPLRAGEVYVTNYKGLASAKIFRVSSRGEADLVVYITKMRGEALNKDEIWYYTKFRGEAVSTIFFTKYRGDLPPILGPLVMLHIRPLYSTKYLAFC